MILGRDKFRLQKDVGFICISSFHTYSFHYKIYSFVFIVIKYLNSLGKENLNLN